MSFSRSPSLLLLLLFPLLTEAQEKAHLEIDSPFASFVEEDFPFFSQTLDARKFGKKSFPDNLTPRGIVVGLGAGTYGCFDPDLLRWSLFWRANEKGEYLTMDGMAPGSYRLPNRKAPSGQDSLPRPIGTALAATPALPGWSLQPGNLDKDPRPRGEADAKEIGLGPIPAEIGRFSGLRLFGKGVSIEYEIAGTPVSEAVDAGKNGVRRTLRIGPHLETLWLRVSLGHEPDWLEIPPSERERELILESGTVARWRDDLPTEGSSLPPVERWPEPVIVESRTVSSSSGTDAFVFDDLPLPVPNPWKRNVRLAGIDFFPDGRAALCTFDGDVWIVEGLHENSASQEWSRFASGLHEPKTVCIVEERIHVSDRNGIVRLHDTDGNGEADWYENFSNIVPQTAETREFAMDMVATRDGGFYLAKGGQVGSTRGIANGTVVRVAPDGRSYEIVATGLRQPYLGYDPSTGILTSSDQQGHWKPATPIYRIETGKYYGFQPAKLKDKAVHPAPIAPPEIWIPHFINQSGASQVWMKHDNGKPANMGALDGELVHIGYNRPELFRVYLNEGHEQGAVVPLLAGFPSGVLKGAVHPIDGRLYLSGFEIWGTSGTRISGLFRVRPGEAPSWLPREVLASKRGVLLRFDGEISPELSAELGRYSVDRWNYEQTHNYGSGNFKLDGTPGQESIAISSARVSIDRKSLFLGIPDMRPSHSLRVTYRLPVPDRATVDSAYLTVWKLPELDLRDRGFDSDEVDLSPKALLTGGPSAVEPSAKLGKETAMRYGCIACHATGEADTVPAPPANAAEGALVAVGPPWKGLWQSHRTFTDGSFIKAVDETYLRESILDPSRRVAEGFATEKTGVGMPSYLGVLRDHEIDSIILYIQTLK